MNTCDMSPAAILGALQASGIVVSALDSATLKVRPAERLTDELRDLLRTHKAAILAYLSSRPALAPELERLVRRLADRYEVSDAEREEMLEAARRDPANALRSHTETERLIGRLTDAAVAQRGPVGSRSEVRR